MWLSTPVRYENLDTYPHSCCVFVHGKHFDRVHLSFEPAVYKNLYYHDVLEYGVGHTAEKPIQSVLLPLIRSNVWNPHPIAHGIYSRLFYHYAAGSRMTGFRGNIQFMFPHKAQSSILDINEEFMDDPRRFINRLQGQGRRI